MDAYDLMFFVWLLLVFWLAFGSMSGILMKKERLCVITILQAISLIFSLHLIYSSDHWWSRLIWVLFSINNGRVTWRSYQQWKNTDDDDDWKQRRKSWGKSKLPKPVTRAIPQPV